MAVRFDDGKDADALRTIGEVSKATGIPTHVLRYWEQQFPMLRPLKRSGGRRYYRKDDVELVQQIDALVNRQGYTLKGAKAALRSKDPDAVIEVEEAVGIDPTIVDALRQLRGRLAAALAG